VFNQAANRADRINFALDGILDSAAGVEGAVRAGGRGFALNNKFTFAELNTVYRNPNLFNKTNFFYEGRPVSPLFRPTFTFPTPK
jgi:hypothetical protein